MGAKAQPGTRARPPYLGPARRRGQVLDAALAIFAEGGFAASSMAAIAARAGVSKPVLYDCFPGGKEELYIALLRHVEREFTEHLLGVFDGIRGLPLEQALTKGLDGFLDYAELHPLGFRIVFGHAGTADPHIVARAEEIRDGIVNAMVDRTVDTLDLRPVLRPVAELYARTVVAVAEQLARMSLRDPGVAREPLVQMAVLFLMKGFEGTIPRRG